MKTLPLYLILATLSITTLRIHSQSKPAASSGAALVQIKSANDALIARQTATLEILKTMETDSDQARIMAKRK